MKKPPSLTTRLVKRALDIAISAIALTVLSPLTLLLGVAVWVEDGRPVLYRARRVGRHGAVFTMLKFRTMRRDAARRGPAITSARDPRVTRTGRVLRASKLDEIPQLWNVLVGQMSLIGPRPEDPAYVALYTEDQRAVLAVRPGISGAAQIVFRDEARLLRPDHVHEDYVDRVLPVKLAIDMDYVTRLTVRRDLILAIQTLWAIVNRGGAENFRQNGKSTPILNRNLNRISTSTLYDS